VDERGQVESYLNTLSICHYVYAALAACGSCFGLVYVGMGVFVGELIKRAPPQPNGPPPEMFGWLFGAVGVVIIVVALTVAVLCFLSAKAMKERRKRMFSLIVAGIVCLTGLLGIALGVFTFIVLLKPEAQKLYEESAG